MQPCGQRRRTTLDQVSGAAKVQATPNRACSWQSHPYIRKHSSQPSETLRPHLKCVIEPRLGALKLLSLVRQVSVLYLKDLMCYGGLNPTVVSCPYRSWSPTWRRLDYVPFLRIKKVGFVRFQINLLCRKCHSLLFGTLQKAHVTASSCWIWQSKLWEVTSWAFKCFFTARKHKKGIPFRVLIQGQRCLQSTFSWHKGLILLVTPWHAFGFSRTAQYETWASGIPECMRKVSAGLFRFVGCVPDVHICEL